MGLRKNYTLYFKGINNYGHDFIIPIINLSLENMDKFTSNYNNYAVMFRCLPNNLKKYISSIINKKSNLESNEFLKDCFLLLDDDGNENNIVFHEDVDVIYITPSELKEEIKSVMLNKFELQKAVISIRKTGDLKYRYDFFEFLYKTFLKEKEVIKMMDTYDTKEAFPNLTGEKLMIASLASDKDNLIILLKKIGQTPEGKRLVALEYKKLYKKIKGDKYLDSDRIKARRNKGLDIVVMKKEILNNLTTFKKNYEKEYS